MQDVHDAILSFAGCPNAALARELVADVSAESGVDVVIGSVEVQEEAAPSGLRFLGSPTIRVDGHDVEPGADERTDVGLSCRGYRTDKGGSDLPTRAWIRSAVLP